MATTNTLLTPQIIANEALMVLEANLVMAGLVHRDYSREFVRVGDTITVRKPASFVAKNFTGKTEAQDITEGSIDVKMDRFRDVSVNVTSKEMALDLKNFSSQIVVPAMSAIAQAVDADILAVGLEKASFTVPATAAPTNLADIGAIGKRLDRKSVPVANRRLVLSPDHKYRYALTENLSKVSYAGTSQTLRDALLGRIYTMDTFMTQNATDTLADTAGTATAFSVTAAKGESKAALSGVTTAAATVKAGDGFIVNGYLYRFAEDKTASGGNIAEIKLDQPVHADLTAAAAMLVNKPHSLGFHRNGIALVTRQLELPRGAGQAAIQSNNGLSVRVVFGYDMETKQDKISFDIIYGVRELDGRMLVRLAG